ncbi:sodium- and chloride-dependent glycine transporter 1-like [Mercenaria mercenaria]|uniref:sodium- and chloride-dependent glycine transporter 1-like n=1 Tax=Mercenaria mercenaria TaxID=6596 RepID=UPI00234F9F0A|nr:sodium- and chloride-dependent glycine transporter 1-like [Mercenaria mercenaria]
MSKRGNWKNWYEFIFSCIGCLVGLGNIWRFPYLCYKNGGGAFLIPYFIFVMLCAIPIFFVEMAYAQFSNLGPGKAWICVPLLRGIGFGMVTMTGVVAIYYTVIMAWTLYFFVMSFSATLPWSNCNNHWNTDVCYMRLSKSANSLSNISNTYINQSDMVFTAIANQSDLSFTTTSNQSDFILEDSTETSVTLKTPTEEFWERNVLELTDGVEHPGTIRWQLLLCLLGAWTIVFLCLVKGIKSSGKVMYVAATAPYVLLTILLVRGLTLDGAIDGLLFYVVPKWDKLLTVSVWGDAAVQMFYSAGLGWGGISTLASYNDFHNNVARDAMILPILDFVTSWFAGCVIFVNLGFMAHSAGLPIDKVISQGPGIVFMVYPEALSQLPLPQLWSVLFFLMLFTVGLDSQIVHVQTVTTAIIDTFPRQLIQRKLQVTLSVCLVSFLLGISCVTQGGIYFLQILDWYCASIAVMLLAFLETVGLAWVYGIERLYKDIELMIGRALPSVWGIFWKYITPFIILLIWIFNLAQLEAVKYGDVTYPRWAIGIGWVIAFISLIPVPVCMIQALRKAEGDTLLEKLKQSTKPSPEWKPANQDLQEQYLEMIQNNVVVFDVKT